MIWVQGLTAAHVRKRAGLPPELPAPSTIKDNLAEFQPAVAKEEVQALPADIFTKELNINDGSIILNIFLELCLIEWSNTDFFYYLQ